MTAQIYINIANEQSFSKVQIDLTDAWTDARTDGRTDNVKTVYSPQTKFAGGIKKLFVHKFVMKFIIH